MRKTGFNSFIAVFITDILFFVFSAFVTFIFLISRTNGEIRAYVILGETLGFIFSRHTISKLYLKILCAIFCVIVKLKIYLRKKINWVYDKVEYYIIVFLKQIFIKLKNVLKSIKKVLKKGVKLLYTIINIKSAENNSYETKT